MRRFALSVILAVALAPLPAEALSLRDVIELSRAGVGDDVLLALIEVDRPVFSTDANTIKMLKDAGVSDRVIIAMVRSGRMQPATPEPVDVAVAEPQPQPQPQVVVIDHHDAQPEIREVPVPVYVPVVPLVGRGHGRQVYDASAYYDARIYGTYPYSGYPSITIPSVAYPFQQPRVEEQHKRKEPVYWGWGGQRRPDTWDEKGRRERQDEKRR